MTDALTLEDDRVRAVVLPDAGARVQSLVDRTSGRELLLQRPAPVPGSEDYGEGSSGGWDELFPNDEPWDGHPDHGRCWRASFEVVLEEAHALDLRTTLARPHVEIERRCSLLPAPRRGLRIDTTLTARGATGPCLWAAHPMLAVEPGWVVDVGGAALEADPDAPGRFAPGPIDGEQAPRALVVPERGLGWGEVLYADAHGEASVGSPDGAWRTRLTYDAGFFGHLWLVTVTGSLGFDLSTLLEPCTNRPYQVDRAAAGAGALELAAGERRSWWVELESLDAAGEAV